MIPPQVHLRRPCYDFSILYKIRFEQVLASSPRCHGCWPPSRDLTGSYIGWSDGRCVQRAGTKSTQYDELDLLRIPRLRSKIAKIDPQHDQLSKDYPGLPPKDFKLVELIIVVRVPPKTSKGITDLLLPQTSIGLKPIVPLRSNCYERIKDPDTGCQSPKAPTVQPRSPGLDGSHNYLAG